MVNFDVKIVGEIERLRAGLEMKNSVDGILFG